MRCPKCRTENTAESKFCRECATPLTQAPGQASFTKTLDTSALELTRGALFAGRYATPAARGAGGMGRVYRAHDTKLNEEVALKLIKPELVAEKRVVERFRNEIKIARKIRHKNVCGMYDFHEEGKTLFLTMEYVRGEDLKSFIHRSRALAIGTAVSVAHQIAEGLAEAHKLGIVHRDLKPGNIMIDKEGQAKVMDYGIARVRQEKGVTGEGAIIGTPEYMSPEQVEGKPADARSDIYSLGVILFEMVVGCPPFEGETPFSIANKHKTEPPPVPKKLLPQLPEALNKLILRCLEKDKARRYQTAEELVADLTAIEQALPMTERALTRAKTRIRTSREITVRLTPKKLLIPAGIVILLAIAITIALFVFKPHPGKIDSLAVLPLVDLSAIRSEAYLVDGVHDALISELSKIHSLNTISRQSVVRYKDSTKSIPVIARELKVEAIVDGSVIQEGEKIRISVGLIDGRTEKRIWGPKPFDRSISEIMSLYSEVALAIAREINAQLTARDIENLSRKLKVNPKAYELYLQARGLGAPGTGPPALDRKLGLLQQAVEIDPDFALGYAYIALTYRDMVVTGSMPMTEAYKKAREAARKAVSLDESLAEAHDALGVIAFEYDWDFAAAEKEYRRAMELGAGNVTDSIILYLSNVGRFDEALALQKRQAESNPMNPPVAFFLLFNARRFDEAIEDANRFLELHPEDWLAKAIRSTCFAVKKMCAESRAENEKILSDYSQIASDVLVLGWLSSSYAICGDRKKAEELVEALRKTGIMDQDPSVLAWTYAPLGDKDLAIAALEQGLVSRSSSMVSIKVDPLLDSLRDEPRFKALLKKVGFEK